MLWMMLTSFTKSMKHGSKLYFLILFTSLFFMLLKNAHASYVHSDLRGALSQFQALRDITQNLLKASPSSVTTTDLPKAKAYQQLNLESSSLQQWMILYGYSDSSCSGDVVYAAGYPCDACIVLYGNGTASSSEQYTCSSTGYTLTTYTDTACTQTERSQTVNTLSCLDLDTPIYQSILSVIRTAATENVMPLPDDASYLTSNYYGGPADCSSGSPQLSISFAQDYCTSVESLSSSYKYDDPYALLYDDLTCSSANPSYSVLPLNCLDFNSSIIALPATCAQQTWTTGSSSASTSSSEILNTRVSKSVFLAIVGALVGLICVIAIFLDFFCQKRAEAAAASDIQRYAFTTLDNNLDEEAAKNNVQMVTLFA